MDQMIRMDAPRIVADKAALRDLIRRPLVTGYSYAPERLAWAARALRRDARISVQWEAAERAGLVRLCQAPDDYADIADLAGDTFDVAIHAATVPGGARTIHAQRKRFERQIAQDGIWGIVGQFRIQDIGPWKHADSVWGCVGYDYLADCDYCIDIMAGTLNALRETLKRRCPTCRQPRRFK